MSAGASGSWSTANPFGVTCQSGWHPVMVTLPFVGQVPVACLPDNANAAVHPFAGSSSDGGGSSGASCSPGWNPVTVLGQTVMCVPSQETWASIGIHTLVAVLGAVLIIVGAIALLRE